MRPRHCPEGWRLRRRLAGWVGALCAGLGLWFSTAPWAQAQADKGIIGDRLDRLQGAQAQQAAQQQAETEVWSPAKIVINLDARCPVVTALGYFGAFAAADADPAKSAELQARYAQLQKTAQPLADEMKKMAVNTTFVGTKFPDSLNQPLQVLCGELYGEVLKLYGDAGLAELKQYVAAQSQGSVVK